MEGWFINEMDYYKLNIYIECLSIYMTISGFYLITLVLEHSIDDKGQN